jgi:hypothetical protein
MGHFTDCEDQTMRSRPTGLLFAVLALLPAIAGAAEGAHEHGVATLQIVIDGNALQANLEIPAHDVVGFEHAPSTPAQRAAVEAALAQLQEAGRVLAPPPAAGCFTKATQVEAAPGRGDDAHAHEEHPHADFRLDWTLRCAQPAALDTATTGLFTLLPDLAQLRVQIVGPLGVRELMLVRPDSVIEFAAD